MSTVVSVALEIVLCWAAVVKVMHLRRSPGDLPLRAVTGLYLCLALGPIAGLPGLHDLVEDAVPGLSRLLLNLLTVTATYCLMAFYGYSLGAPGTEARLRRRLFGLFGAQAVMIAAWATAPEPVRVSPGSLDNLDDRHAAIFVVAALGYMGYGLAYAFRWSVTYSRAAHRARLRTSLRIVSVALACLLVACLTKAGVALALGLVEGLSTDDAALVVLSKVYPSLVLLGTLLIAIGFLFPVVAALPGRVARARERRKLFRRLGPLWNRMREAFPQLVLTRDETAGSGIRTRWMPWTYRAYYRRVIEIRDTIVQLAPYYDPALVPEAHSGDDLRVRAVLTADALRRKIDGRPVEDPYPLPALGGDDLDSDARWLAGLAAALEQVPADQSSEPVSSSTSSIRKT